MSRHAVLAIAYMASCARDPALPAARFANAPIVWVVDDRRDVPVRPDKYIDRQVLDGFDAEIEEPLDRGLSLPPDRRALGVNALDEVPDSTWFTNRIGSRDLSEDDIRRGPVTHDSPELHAPWTVHGTKPGGGARSGLIITDTRGERYMLKFDEAIYPERESGTHVVVNRLLWACGYHVAEDEVVLFRKDDLVLDPHADVRKHNGSTTGPLTRAALDDALAHVAHAPDGRIRALASRWLDGKPLGGPARHGRRGGDPNDRIPHQLRRDLRGERPILAWLDHVDLGRGNFLDMWVADRGGRHHVEHYQIDFGGALGAMGSGRADARLGYTYELDWSQMMRELVTFGLTSRPWEHDLAPALRGVAPAFVAEPFDPGGWHPTTPYTPFVVADRFDQFWGAKLLVRFSRTQIRAAVEAGRFSDPRAVDYLTDTLVARQRATVGYWFARVNPLDGFAASADGGGAALCFDDLAVNAGLVAPATSYAVTPHAADGRAIGARVVVAGSTGRQCLAPLPLAAADAGYTIFEVVTQRPRFAGKTYIHVARDPHTRAPRVIGIWRD